ncbi:MAG: DUF2029 domain-containing protein [Proteobacteria bacterium]|nr:DUF2029 domain-containing protein [Pseudomonadota bacterium]
MSPRLKTALLLLLATIAIGWHGANVQRAWEHSGKGTAARDFASYYYADLAADAGKDPYTVKSLAGQARPRGYRQVLHPFFYPPPFLLVTSWLSKLDIKTAYGVWFWLDELAVLAVALALGWWWRRLGIGVTVLVTFALALLTAITNNHSMGQANLPVLALVIGGLWADSDGRSELGGSLMGVACMLKMSPALFVAWWLLRGRTTSAIWAVGMGIVLSIATLWVMPLETQIRFYTEVLPTFGSGDYNGLIVPIGLFGNHSIPDIFNALWPSPGGNVLSSNAQMLSTVTALMLPALTLYRLRDDPVDAWAAAGQVGALCVCVLLIPVYTYEHHVVFALPAAVATLGAAIHGRLHRGWIPTLLLAWALWCAPLPVFKQQAMALGGIAGVLIEESKFLALLLFYAASLWLGSALHIPAKAEST